MGLSEAVCVAWLLKRGAAVERLERGVWVVQQLPQQQAVHRHARGCVLVGRVGVLCGCVEVQLWL